MRLILFALFFVTSAVRAQHALTPTEVNAKPRLMSAMEFASHYPSKDPEVAALLKRYRSLGKLKHLPQYSAEYAANIISWQMPHGGFGLHEIEPYDSAWDGKKSRSEWQSKGVELGNFDDYATIAEIRYLAAAYAALEDQEIRHKIRGSVSKALQFILTSQYPGGGWPQVYPERKKRIYSNYVTLNDDAMIRIMVLLSDVLASESPFDSDLTHQIDRGQLIQVLTQGVENLLSAQIVNQGRLTIWAAQYHPDTYQPMPARSFELVSKSSRESVGVLVYLMNWPQRDERVTQAVNSGISWFENNRVINRKFENGVIVPSDGASLWYRFYEVDEDTPLFADRDGIKRTRLEQVSEERRTGYSWAGSYAKQLLKVVDAAPTQ